MNVVKDCLEYFTKIQLLTRIVVNQIADRQ